MPAFAIRPKSRELGTRKACKHADDGIVTRHIVAADRAQQMAGGKRRRPAARLARNKESCDAGDVFEKHLKQRVREMMQKKTGRYRIVRSIIFQEHEYIVSNNSRFPAQIFERGECGACDDI